MKLYGQLVYGIFWLSAICMAKPTATRKRSSTQKSFQPFGGLEDRRCYRPRWFTEPKCKLSAAAHQLRANGGNDSCRTHPQYDCNSIYVAMEGPGDQSMNALTSVCKEGDILRGFQSTDHKSTTCAFRYVCKKHTRDVIPSTYWEAEKLEGGTCNTTFRHKCSTVRVAIPFLVSQGCDENVGQKRYKVETISVIQGYTCTH